MTLSPGILLRDYRIHSLIGNGGMGEVYLAEEVTLERMVAIKVLRQDATANQHFVDRFRNEARVLAHLNHPSIVGLYSFFAEGDTYYLVMQYAPGITLAELIRRTGPIPEDRAMRIFTQIGEALQYAHGQGVVHRDIKPSNIMVDTEREDRALVMDFGIARLVADQHLTRSGIQVGTPCYMSPEQVLGEKEITGRTDIYSAGVVLYEMLSGSMPYDLNTESLYNVQSRIVHEPLPDPRMKYEFIGNASIALLQRLTNKDPNARPPSIRDAIHPNTAASQPAAGNTGSKTDRPAVVFPGSYKPPAGDQGVHFSTGQPAAAKSPLPASNADMIVVEGGRFKMGSEIFDHCQPTHQVFLDPFLIGRLPVTQRQWQDVMGSNPSRFRGGHLPVEAVSWFDAIHYCNKLSIREGLQPCYSGDNANIVCDWSANGYRLPTEAEWEFAARGGNQGRGYPYSGSVNASHVAWFGIHTTQKAGSKAPNELGAFDMSGNVWEWCWDWFGDYLPGMVDNPRGADSGLFRVMRGGAYNIIETNCHVSYRACNSADYKNASIGIRLARNLQ